MLKQLSLDGLLLICIAVAGCASLSSDIFLIKNVDEQGKAKALTDAGVSRYELELVARQNYEKINEIKKYFTVALRYDPTNAKAQQYIGLIEQFREAHLREKIAQAQEALKKQTRTEEEDYILCLLVQQAYALDPEHQEVKALREGTDELRDSLVKTYVERARSAKSGISDSGPKEKREKALIESAVYLERVLAIAPENIETRTEIKAVREELGAVFDSHAVAAQQHVGAGKFEEAKKEVDYLDTLNRRIGNTRDEDVKRLSYDLNYRWAETLYGKKQWRLAEAKVNLAIESKETNEALELKEKVRTELEKSRKKPADSASVSKLLKEIEELIEKGELGAAHRMIVDTMKRKPDKAATQKLEEFSVRIRDQLKTLYEKAVEHYRHEDFRKAVELFTIVAEIDQNYEKVSDYLDKAKAKQKLLESYGEK